MKDYFIRRSLLTVVALVGLIVVVFLFTQSIGDPASIMLPDWATEEMIQALRDKMGLNDPLYVQFGRYVSGLLRLDLGTSLWQGIPNLDLIMSRLPATFILALVAISLAAFGGVFLGALAAIWPRSVVDRVISFITTLAVTSVDFWVALMLILLVSVKLGWLPTSGYGEVKHIVLPALMIALRPMGRIAQVTRPAIMDELAKPYILAARARGLSTSRVIVRHAARNAGIVLLTLTGYEFAGLVNGSAIIETVFGWPGVGFLLVQAIKLRDWPLIVGTTIVVAVMVIVINFAIDLIYGWLDPRIRYH
ncbi:MAG: ABC transporter permease [Chloroflexi bacterium]|nr:ABC transporter permease [Chloroflexota bacterium]